MGIDTVRLKSPQVGELVAKRVEAMGETFRRLSNETGQTLWEVTRTNLTGSHDSRIMVKPMRTDWVKRKSGRLDEVPCPPYLMVECSIPKMLYGQNVYGCLEDFQAACALLHQVLERKLRVKLPEVARWRVQRVDWAENYRLPYQAVQEFFEGIYHIAFPRRRMQKHGEHSVFVPGTTTTIKLYHKGPEFHEHDGARLRTQVSAILRASLGNRMKPHEIERKARRYVHALQRLANGRLRVEVEIKAEKLDYDFETRPRVADVATDYLKSVHDAEISRLLREGATATNTVRSSLAVRDRLFASYSPRQASTLYAFWVELARHADFEVKDRRSRSTFYRLRKQLEHAGVSWFATDLQAIERQGTLLPADFSPVRSDPRRCTGQVRARMPLDFLAADVQLSQAA